MNTKFIHTVMIAFLLIVFGIISSPLSGFSQQQVKENLFREAKVLLDDAQEAKAGLYSPEYFQKGFELYKEAEEDFSEGKKLENIRKKLEKASTLLKQSIETTRLSKLTLEETTNSREASIEQKASEWAPDLFQEAEELFRKAAKKVEDGKTNDAKEIGVKASKAYRKAELAAIKNRILGDTWQTLDECKEKDVSEYAPLTLEKAKSLADKSESILDKDRYNQDEAARVAQEAAYEANHALFLAKVIKELRENEKQIEKYILDIEQQFQKISEALRLDLEFDGGFQGPAYKIVESILELRKENNKQENKIDSLETKVAGLSTRIENLKAGKLKELSGKLSELEKIVEEQRAVKKRLNRIEKLFNPDEAKVFQKGNDIIIRLYGLNFPSGRSIIHPEYFSLLTKVIKAIREFENAQVRIEGHTDSQGSNTLNQKLSTDRAESVVQYLLANSDIDSSRVSSIGYGEERPIASNDTGEGRRLNRRIDVVIMPTNKD